MMFPKDKSGQWKGKEKDLQSICESLINQYDVRYIHIPDPLLHHLRLKSPAWIAKISSRVFKGVPDLLIFSGERCLLVELKTATGKLSQGQSQWHKGVKVHIVRSFEEFSNLFLTWLDGD